MLRAQYETRGPVPQDVIQAIEIKEAVAAAASGGRSGKILIVPRDRP